MPEGAREQQRGVGRISGRTAAWLAWSVWARSLALTVLALVLLALNLSRPDTHIFDWWFGNTLAVIDVSVGAIVASGRPENPIGWLLLISGLAIIIGRFSAQYAIYLCPASPTRLASRERSAGLDRFWLLPIYAGIQVLYLLLFPTGRLPSKRWRPEGSTTQPRP